MKTVYKYAVPLSPNSNITSVPMPTGAKLLHVDAQNGAFFAWALVESETRTTEECHLLVSGTGHEVPETPGKVLRFVNTILVYDGAMVFHVFELCTPTVGSTESCSE